MNININESTLIQIQLAIVVVALLVILVRSYPRLSDGKVWLTRACNYALVGLGVFALLAYVNFQPFSPRQQYRDSFHYYIGSKYFPELGYTRLYACVARAEAESTDPSVRISAYSRLIGDIGIAEGQANVVTRLVPARRYIFDDAFCRSRFSALRWDNFKSDVAFFHSRMSDWNWTATQGDHGFNPPPAWTLMGGFISNMIPLSDPALMGVTLIDIALLFGIIACMVWAFGLSTAAFAVIIGTATIDSWDMIGGSMLRFDWLFMAIFSICTMKREHYVLAGAALGYAAMLRLFPAVFALGPFAGLLYAVYKRQHDLKATYANFFAGMVISSAVLVASATAVYGGDAYKGFFDNSKRHAAVIALNNVGLRQVLVYGFDEKSHQRTFKTLDDRIPWRTAIIEARKKVAPIYVAVVAVALLLFIPAALSCGPWQSVALSALFVPFMWTELASYYYLLLMIAATLFADNWKVAFPLLGVGVVSGIGRLYGMNMGDFHVLLSAVICIGALVIWWQINTRTLFWRQALSIFRIRKT